MAGGYCTKLLAALGAEVIKVERPGRATRSGACPFKDDVPNPETSVVHLHLSMAKKSITLDPSSRPRPGPLRLLDSERRARR